MKIILVRHGRTISNNEKTFSEESTSICDEAHQELLFTKSKLVSLHFEKIYASPLLRVRQTAKVLGCESLIFDERIKERDFGEFKGKSQWRWRGL